MISSNDKKVIVSEFVQDDSERTVKFMHGSSVARDIIPVTVLHVKINKVYEAKTVEVPVHHLKRFAYTFCIALRGIGFGKASSGEKIIDLSYGNHVIAFILKNIEHG